MVKPTATLPPKLPPSGMPSTPTAHFPLTRENISTNLDNILRQLHSYDLTQQQDYQSLTSNLCVSNAQFHYILAKFPPGRGAIVAFWDFFLLVSLLCPPAHFCYRA